MNKGLLVTTAIGLLLVGSVARAQNQSAPDQNDDDTWDGPGYYLETPTTYTSDGLKLLGLKFGGPFASLDACEAYFRDQQSVTGDDGKNESCVYHGSPVQYAKMPCFLTTACAEHAGLADDCDELMLMRALRDRYLDKFDEGRLVIEQYYRIAPPILERMRRTPGRSRALAWILREVRATAQDVACGDMETATARYAAMVLRLQQRYGVTA